MIFFRIHTQNPFNSSVSEFMHHKVSTKLSTTVYKYHCEWTTWYLLNMQISKCIYMIQFMSGAYSLSHFRVEYEKHLWLIDLPLIQSIYTVSALSGINLRKCTLMSDMTLAWMLNSASQWAVFGCWRSNSVHKSVPFISICEHAVFLEC